MDPYYLALFCMLMSVVSGWAVSRWVPLLSTPLVVTALGLFYACAVADADELDGMNSEYALNFVFLPFLTYSGRMELDVRLAARIEAQFLLVAVLGSLAMTWANAVVLRFFLSGDLGWPGLIAIGSVFTSFSLGPISGTLKSSGASTRFLTMVIGESIFGVFVPVIFVSLGNNFIFHGTTSAADSFLYLIRSEINALSIGVLIGMLFLSAIESFSSKYSSKDKLIQIVLTLACPFAAMHSAGFALSNGSDPLIGKSAILSAGIVVSWKMWLSLASKEIFETVWQVVGLFGEGTSFVSGALLGHTLRSAAAHHSNALAYWAVRVVLAFLCFSAIRLVVVLMLWPVVNLLGQRVSFNGR
jgi:hypothetical protein